jgi:cephalosporin hydroxylase
MKLEDITLILGVDAAHLEELRLVWPGWMRFKPELRSMPCVVFYDAGQVSPAEMTFMSEHPQVRYVPWDLPHAQNQREKMLTGFVHVPAREVQTPWYLKLDTDVIATEPGEWIKPKWFEPDEKGELPVFIAPAWGYSKPRYVMDVLDDWGDGVPMLAKKPRLNLPYSDRSSIVRHPRIISWLFFGRTDWTREMAALCGKNGRMPVPSQDTFMTYCAVRLGCGHVRTRMSNHGWKHQRPRRAQAEKITAKLLNKGNQRGVIYYNCGTSCTVRLLVSLVSLRKHYAGPVTILSEGEASHLLCERIGAALDARVIKWESGVKQGKNTPFLAKTRLHLGTPYETTVALDSDTLVMGPIDELFEVAEQDMFCVAQLGNWRTTGRIIQGRLRKWAGILPEDLDAAIQFGPAINTGVTAFRKDASIFEEWYPAAEQGREHFIPDEVSCQMLMHRHQHRILDGRWNRSCRHDDPDLSETRVIHYHGRKHCRKGLPFHADKWVAAYEEITRQNLADINSWTPAGDRQLIRHIKERRKALSVGDAAKIATLAGQCRVYQTDLWCRRGHLNQDQADKYAEICERLQPRSVLETGFCTGRSAACVLHHSKSLERMISIDINLDYKAPHGRRMAALLEKRFPFWRIIENSSRVILTPDFFHQEFPQGIDLATIDGDHSYDGCMHDLEAVAPFMTPNGLMMVDDYRSGPPNGTRIDSVTQSVDDFLTKNQGSFVGERWHKLGKGFCIIRRVS